MTIRATGAKDYPFYDVFTEAERLVREGHTVHQKFTCASCGSRQTMEEANVFHKLGKCEECGHTTDIEAQGCNYMAMFGVPGPSATRK